MRGTDIIVLGVEKKTTAKLQESRTVRKIVQLDDHIALAFAGLTADARVLINKARLECQSYSLSSEEPPSVEYISKYIAGVQQVAACPPPQNTDHIIHRHKFAQICEPKTNNPYQLMILQMKKYTQSGGVRPFGISTLLIGFDHGVPRLFQTDPSGTYAEWKVPTPPSCQKRWQH